MLPRLQALSDIDQDFEDTSRNPINEQNHFYPQDPDNDEGIHEIQHDLSQQELPHSPTSPPLNHNSGELPHVPQPESEPVDEGGSSSNDDNGAMLDGGDEDNTDADDSDLKAARLKDDLDEEMLTNTLLRNSRSLTISRSSQYAFSMTLSLVRKEYIKLSEPQSNDSQATNSTRAMW